MRKKNPPKRLQREDTPPEDPLPKIPEGTRLAVVFDKLPNIIAPEFLDLLADFKVCFLQDTRDARLPELINRVAERLDLSCRIRASIIPDAGMGLFANRNIEKHEVICEYGGVSMSHDYPLYHNNESSPYMTETQTLGFVDGEICFDLKQMGRWCNGMPPGQEERLNARFNEDLDSKRLYLVATRPIERGEEIYLDYGKFYGWKKRARIECGYCGIKSGKLYYEANNPKNVFCGIQCQRSAAKLA